MRQTLSTGVQNWHLYYPFWCCMTWNAMTVETTFKHGNMFLRCSFFKQSNIYLLRCVELQAYNLQHVRKCSHLNRIYLGNTYRNTHFLLHHHLYVQWQINTIATINIDTVYTMYIHCIQHIDSF